ncbi:DUF4440 domain-containing protein [Rhodobacteraceae bacterium NNCM2]|nr:DUF4440 domain-containing protein [Coraliihabitans acroporae]
MSTTNFVSRIIGTALVAILLIGTTNALAGDYASKVREMNAAWDAAFNDGDAVKVAGMYAEDARVITGDGTIVEGPAEIEALFKGFIDSGFGQHEITMATADGNSDVIYESGEWSGVGGDGKTYGGKLVNIYERQSDGSWKTVIHIWN